MTAASSYPDAVPAPRLGEPGNPVVVDNGSIRVTGTAGSIVHIRLTSDLTGVVQGDLGDRLAFSFDGDFGMVGIVPEGAPAPGTRDTDQLSVAELKPALLCSKPATCEQDHAGSYNYLDGWVTAPSNLQLLPAGDYIVGLFGAVGAHVDMTIRDYADKYAPTVVTQFYPSVYTVGRTVDLPNTDTSLTPAHGELASAFQAPSVGRRALGAVLVGIENPGDAGGAGSGYGYETCAQAFTRRRSAHTNNDACYRQSNRRDGGTISGHNPDTGASQSVPYTLVAGGIGADGRFEASPAGAGFDIPGCDGSCHVVGIGANIALDS